MICRRCQTPNLDSATVCSRCGSFLFDRPARRKRARWYLYPVLALALLAGGYFVRALLTRTPPAAGEKGSGPAPGQTAVTSPISASAVSPAYQGEIIARAAGGEAVSRFTSSFSREGWTAMPVWGALGGERLVLKTADQSELAVDEGHWRAGDPVVLWRVRAEGESTARELASWQPQLPLQWFSSSSGSQGVAMEIISPRERGSFLCFDLPETVTEPGILVQDGRIVGWTFGQGMIKAYLWKGQGGPDLAADTSAEDILARVSANNREAAIRKALAGEEGTSVLKLFEGLAAAFRLPSLLSPDDLPPRVNPRAAVLQMRALASRLLQAGGAADVARVLDDRVLAEASDPELIADAVRAVVMRQDPSEGLARLDRARKAIVEKTGQDMPALKELQSRLYKDWLRESLTRPTGHSALVIFEEARRVFPDDPELHLLGVEASLAEDTRERAKELLGERDYPPPWKERARQLEARIQAEEDQDVISVPIAVQDNQMTVQVLINGSYLQTFIIDTGASRSSLPWSAIEPLHLAVDDTSPVTGVVTVSGILVTYEVTLKSLEIQKVRRDNLKVFLVDLPLHPDVGLLGMDFFGPYRLEVDQTNRVIKLKKR